jgi:hypothetical protein
MGTGTWVMIAIAAWIALSLPVGLLVGAVARNGKRAPQRPGPSAATREGLAAAGHAVAPAAARRACAPRRNRIADLTQA